MTPRTSGTAAPRPPFRRLRAFAFDPSLSTYLHTATINQVTLKIPWEEDLEPGPVGEYLEVVDVDPASEACYAPVDLNHPYLLAQDGLLPSESSPQFHQQMVYAVAMTTVRNFERALGRRALWAYRTYVDERDEIQDEFVRQLRIYPHGLREANAYYSPDKKALLFGYFPASKARPGANLPGGIVFTCLSHDIVAHETTHALLDGMHQRYVEPSNVDALALHEAFADIVALFQHFSHPDVLRDQIARTRGDLERQNLLAQLAQQFGQAIGRYGALRDALGEVDSESGEWRPREPDPKQLDATVEPHARGAILVAAVFDAFLTIYKWRIADLLRIATGGTGILPAGDLHPDLVGRLSEEVAKVASHVLRMCIRALDYCPPVDVTFGDYLRALITADADLLSDDRLNYRVAFIEAFRRRGLYPLDARSLSEGSLLWQAPEADDQAVFAQALHGVDALRALVPDWGPRSERAEVFRQCRKAQAVLHTWLVDPDRPEVTRAVGLTLDPDAPATIYRQRGLPAIEVHSARPAHRVGPDGHTISDLVVELTQRRRGYYDEHVQREADAGQIEFPEPDFIYRGGCTLLINVETGQVRYCVGKGITSARRLESQRRYLTRRRSGSRQATYFGGAAEAEPFALLHRSHGSQEVIV